MSRLLRNTSRGCRHGYQSVASIKATSGEPDLEAFRRDFWLPELPFLLTSSHHFPASRTWFNHEPGSSHVSFSDRMEEHHDLILPYEFIISSAHPETDTNSDLPTKNLQDFREWLLSSSRDGNHGNAQLLEILENIIQLGFNSDRSRFYQFSAPLGLLLRGCQFNRTRGHHSERIKRLYIAQCGIDRLPETLSKDIPVPGIVKETGRGDIYDSSIWLGLEPTYTPLHRDPNPNLFCQLVGSKTIRLMPPGPGMALFTRVRQQLGSPGNSRFRTTEMMDGPERELLHHAVWVDESRSRDMVQASLGPGDALFIPKGWWHSVVSAGDDEGNLNASVNWWFR
ncbi:hypothetical protein F5X96DRAFT_679028 [Biscogniauxia mediterranea]|nr:hypothetical protein F5X96DRAFT_679028 [Biscogniauxia mediterranea]